jgi:uncharacterized protein (DUF433 family)/uncharacterized protein YuzE
MRIHYDPTADVLKIVFHETAAATRPLGDGMAGAYDAEGRLTGIEFREAGKRLGDLATLRSAIREGVGPPICQSMPPSTIVTDHIVLDQRGVAWVDDTNVKVIEIVLDKLGYGMSPEQIHEEFPHLSLAQIHAAFAYYYDHKAEFDVEIERQYQEYLALWKAQGKDTPLHKKLRAAGKIP